MTALSSVNVVRRVLPSKNRLPASPPLSRLNASRRSVHTMSPVFMRQLVSTEDLQ
jgi:hypothetical protein